MLERLFTMGYLVPGSLEKLDAFVQQENAVLLDIRYSPTSRIPVFRQSALQARYPDAYEYCFELGNKNYRDSDRGIELVNAFVGVPYVVTLLRHSRLVLLLCACKDYETCHRKVVYDLVAQALASEVMSL